MCGIAGSITAGPSMPPPDAVLAALAVRGPDAQGQWSTRHGPWNVALLHRRLAILDLSTAAGQPMLRGRLAVVFNGEIYNYVEIREELRRIGHCFTTQSDTEVLLASYAQWKEECLARLRGMFAFALWDGERNALFCARDRAGEKPFSFCFDGRSFYFASEIKALLEFGPVVPRRPNWSRLSEFLVRSYQPVGMDATEMSNSAGCPPGAPTCFDGIFELPPGETLLVEPDGDSLRLARRPYWTLPSPGSQASVSPEELRAALAESVRQQLRSDVPVGTCVSGGIDSPSVAVTVARMRGDPAAAQFRYQGVHAFAPGPGSDERRYVAALAERSGLEVSYVEITGAGCRDEIDDLVYRQEMPLLSPSVYAQRCVFRRARELGLKVMLDGQGADELLAGYDWTIPFTLRAIARRLGWTEAWRQFRAVARGGRSAAALLARAVIASLRRPRGAAGSAEDRSPTLRAAFGTISLPALLHYADRNAMTFGVEARLPFLDPPLIDLAARLWPEDCLRDGWTKAILRRAMADELPPAILQRRDKTAFAVPERRWIAGELREAVRQSLEHRLWKELDPRLARRVRRNALGETEGGGYNRSAWKALCTARWYERFF